MDGNSQANQLQNIYDTVPCGILRFRRQGDNFELLSLNRAAQTLLGYSDREEGIADWHNGIAGSVLVEDWPELKHANASLQNVGDSVEITYRARRLDGGVRWLSGFNTLVESMDGCDIIQRTMFDVTYRQLLEEQLRQEREMYRIAMESGSVVMFEYRIDEDLFASYEPQPQGGVRRMEIPHYRLSVENGAIVHPDDERIILENLCQGQAEIFECRFLSQNEDSYQWYRVTGKLVAGAGRGRVVGTLRNIQKEKESAIADREALQMHQLAIQALSHTYLSIYYIDLPKNAYYGVRTPDSRSTTIPRSGEFQSVMSIYFASHAAPEDLPRLLPYSDPKYLTERLRAVGDRLEVEFSPRSNSESPVWLHIEYQLASTENGGPKHAVCAFRDVTESHRIQEEHLEEERRAKRALEDAYHTAAEASKAKSDFLSKMSHDMRTPMNAIIGMTTVALQYSADPEKVLDCLGKIQVSGRHLLHLINEVLDMSRIENNKISLNESVFDIVELLSETAEMMRTEIEKRSHRLVLTTDVRHRRVLGDFLRIQEVLLNLLSNAVKYTRNSGCIRLSITEEGFFSNAACRYSIVVEDNGIGMTEDFLKRMFQPFERAEDSRVSSVQGTGLGMTITQNLIRLMNGSIKVESEPEKGTKATVTLSLQISSGSEPPAEAKEDGAELNYNARILLVEDNDLNREITQSLLEIIGLQAAEEAVNGQEAVEKFAASPVGYYDAVLMDIQMPVMDGYGATAAIRSLQRPDAGSVPIIALTANAFAEDVSLARQSGMNEHLAKPLEIDTLTSALKRWL